MEISKHHPVVIFLDHAPFTSSLTHHTREDIGSYARLVEIGFSFEPLSYEDPSICVPLMERWWSYTDVLLLRVDQLLLPSLSRSVVMAVGISLEWVRCVRMCCFMLSFRVNALLQMGQWTLFSPVCFFP